MKIVPIPKALSPRMALVAEHLSKRLGDKAGGWQNYKASEGLVGRLTKPADQGYNLSADFHRPNDPKTTIALSFLSMLNIEAGQPGSTIVLQDNMIERKTIEVDIPENVEVSKEVSHTFETTESFSEAFTKAHKEAWEAGGKASLSLGYGGISGAVEAWGKYGQENNESHSGSHEKASKTSDTVTEVFKFKGPVQFHVEAYRSRRRERKTLRALANLDGKLFIYAPGYKGPLEFMTFWTQFMPVAQGLGDDSIYGYDLFYDNPLTESEVDAIENSGKSLIEFTVDYDNVLTESLKPV